MLGQNHATHSTPMFWVTWPFCNPALIIINVYFQWSNYFLFHWMQMNAWKYCMQNILSHCWEKKSLLISRTFYIFAGKLLNLSTLAWFCLRPLNCTSYPVWSFPKRDEEGHWLFREVAEFARMVCCLLQPPDSPAIFITILLRSDHSMSSSQLGFKKPCKIWRVIDSAGKLHDWQWRRRKLG